MSESVGCSNREKLKIFIWFAAAYSVLYIIPNFSSTNRSVELPLTPWDLAIPFLPWTFLIYTSDYLFIFFAIVTIRNAQEFKQFSRMMFLALIIGGGFFWFFPTSYPRPTGTETSSPWIQALIHFVYTADSPKNCFPSMHVAFTTLSAYSLRRSTKIRQVFYSLWCLAIIVSTLTTKQHYLSDVVGGLGVVLLVIVLEKTLFSRLRHLRSLV